MPNYAVSMKTQNINAKKKDEAEHRNQWKKTPQVATF